MELLIVIIGLSAIISTAVLVGFIAGRDYFWSRQNYMSRLNDGGSK